MSFISGVSFKRGSSVIAFDTSELNFSFTVAGSHGPIILLNMRWFFSCTSQVHEVHVVEYIILASRYIILLEKGSMEV